MAVALPPADALALWAGVVAIGVFHGLNPAMGWPLAVANGLTQRRAAAVPITFAALGAGHLLAMTVVLVPFALLGWLLQWSREIRLVAGSAVLLFGLARIFARRRHPRWLARVRPTQLLLWSLLMATAHGAALMLLPVMLGLCTTPADAAATVPDPLDHAATMRLMAGNLGTALAVSLLHTAAMMASGLAIAWIVYRHLGLQALRSSWFDLDRAWGVALSASGLAALAMAWSA